jgi:predicted O-methyltransferase YrrM
MILKKLIAGNKVRKTRIHDEKGNRVSMENLIVHGPRAIISGALRIVFGYRPKMPWIAYSSIKVLKAHLSKNSRVLEFGSGMSTVWYAQNAGEVYSVEDFKPWYDKVELFLQAEGIKNVKYFHALDKRSYCEYMAQDTTGFDLIMVDGSVRSKCIANSLKLLRTGGILYLDNSDKDSAGKNGDMREAERILAEFAVSQNLKLVQITDFAPTQLFAQQGSYVKIPS